AGEFLGSVLGDGLQGAQKPAQEQSQSQAGQPEDRPSSDWMTNLGPSEVDAQGLGLRPGLGAVGLQPPANWGDDLSHGTDGAMYEQLVDAFRNPPLLDRSHFVELASASGYDGGLTLIHPESMDSGQPGHDLYGTDSPGTEDSITGPSYDGISATAGRGTYEDPRRGADIEVRASDSDDVPEWQINNAGNGIQMPRYSAVNAAEVTPPTTTGSALLDEGIERATGTVLGVASVVHAGAQLASDQVWAVGNAVTGGWLANNVPAAQTAVARNTELGHSLLNLPGQISRGALRAATGNWYGATQGASDALQLDHIQAANARGAYLSAQVMATQNAINMAGLAAGGVGSARAGLGLAAAQDVRMGAQLAMEDAAANLSGSRRLTSQLEEVSIESARSIGRPALEQGGLTRLALPRTPGLGATSTTAELLQTGAIPGRDGVVLTQRHVTFGDLWRLSENSGVEFLLTRENGQFVLRSGSPTNVQIPGGVRPIAHTHPLDADGLNSPLPSKADINVLNDYWARNPAISRPVSQIIIGTNQTTVFRATGLDPWGK
ncbi:MAG TPA: hypothetical protein VMA55_14405, partial [Acidovorax sp.]|nr:hypothetical protein [Acidovorax sp.]